MPDLLPQLSGAMHVALRAGSGLVVLGTIATLWPHARRFFTSERWGGYARSSPATDALQNPVVAPILLGVWGLSGALLVLGRWTLVAAAVNLAFAWYFFVAMRWKGVLRGMGAPGFMLYWLALVTLLVELAWTVAPVLLPLVLLTAQVDLALIMLSAGIYKVAAGYPRGEGMEYGMANPEWGYWWRFWSRVSPRHIVFQVLDQLAWLTEVVAAILMLLPPTRWLGGILITLSFTFIPTLIRLGWLCLTVVVGTLLFASPGSPLDRLAAAVVPAGMATPPASAGLPAVATTFLGAAIAIYLVLLPLAHAGIAFNFYGRRSLRPAALQRFLERYTNTFGIIIWRVFSVDHTSFFVNVYRRSRAADSRELLSHWGAWTERRFNNVGEAIVVTTVFTTLKYYPSNSEQFRDRLLRYARTLPHEPDEVLLFEYLTLRKAARRFELVPVAEFEVDLSSESVVERTLSGEVSVRSAHAASPVFEGARPGSYVPLGR